MSAKLLLYLLDSSLKRLNLLLLLTKLLKVLSRLLCFLKLLLKLVVILLYLIELSLIPLLSTLRLLESGSCLYKLIIKLSYLA